MVPATSAAELLQFSAAQQMIVPRWNRGTTLEDVEGIQNTVPLAGFEPAALCLEGIRSATELQGRYVAF